MALKVHESLTIAGGAESRGLSSRRKELDYEFVNVNMHATGDHKPTTFPCPQREYKFDDSPYRQVPASRMEIAETPSSRGAITQYIAHTYVDKGTQLIVPDQQEDGDHVDVDGSRGSEIRPCSYEARLRDRYKAGAWSLTTDECGGGAVRGATRQNSRCLRGTVEGIPNTWAEIAFTLVDLHHTLLS
nr:glutathione S-transferase [Ipomoea batatas]